MDYKSFKSRSGTKRCVTGRSLLHGRSGTTVVETAIVLPVVFLLVLGLIISGFGIFRYHQIAHLSQESARWLSLRGPRYQSLTESNEPTAQDVLNNVIYPKAISLAQDQLACNVIWNNDQSTVTVEVTYNWVPEAYWDTIVFRSISESPVLQ